MISLESPGSFTNTEKFLKEMQRLDVLGVMQHYAAQGVAALRSATPTDTGLTAASWGYRISSGGGVYEIAWTNSDTENGFPVAVMLQFGHGTGTGGYVQGRDYINPAIKPIFDLIADQVWKAVTSA